MDAIVDTFRVFAFKNISVRTTDKVHYANVEKSSELVVEFRRNIAHQIQSSHNQVFLAGRTTVTLLQSSQNLLLSRSL